METVELKGDDYIVYFDDTEELNYQLCTQLLRDLRQKFSNKRFIGMLRGIDFKELDDKEIEDLIQLLKEMQEARSAAAKSLTLKEEYDQWAKTNKTADTTS